MKHRLPLLANFSTSITFFTRSTPFTSSTFNYQMIEYNARFVPFQNGTYVTVINRDNKDLNFTTKPVNLPGSPIPPPP